MKRSQLVLLTSICVMEKVRDRKEGSRGRARPLTDLRRPARSRPLALHVHVDRRGITDVHVHWGGTGPVLHGFTLRKQGSHK